jgi:hypothetical protein
MHDETLQAQIAAVRKTTLIYEQQHFVFVDDE